MSWAIWITGRPGSGKTTLARAAAQALHERGVPVQVLELSTARKAMLGGHPETEHERDLVYRALAYAALAVTSAGVPVIVDATAPRRALREWARTLIPHFAEVQLVCSPEVCVVREQTARWHAPSAEATLTATLPELAIDYEVSLRPELTLDTEVHERWAAVEEVLRLAQHLERTTDLRH